jgi:uncharacterized protein YgiM (DUF1202 family)
MQGLQFHHCAFEHFIAVTIVALSGLLAQAVEVKPYEARIVASGATIQSGPGEKFYPTDTLAKGDLVEVYREKPGGWLGIRPTPNSFSWIAGRDLTVQEGGVGEVNKDDAASRIGSRLSDKHNASQVRLKKGETVEVLGEEKFAGETWYKIAPPAGEFRWIQSSVIERTGPIQQVSAESVAPTKSPAADPKGSAPNPFPGSSESNSAVAPPLIPTKPTATPITSGSIPSSSPAALAPVAKVASTAASAPPSGPPPANSTATNSDDDLHHALTAIEIRLSRMAAAPVNLWNTEGLERDAAQLMSRAQTPADRDAVQSTIGKINQFASISRRTGSPTNSAVAAGTSPVTPIPGQAGPVAANAPGNPYDAVGVLRPVVSRRPGAPQFALVDDHGQVLTFVTPTPDMNLQPYIGKRVGVVGNRGYIAEFNRTHVTAARVTPITENIMR